MQRISIYYVRAACCGAVGVWGSALGERASARACGGQAIHAERSPPAALCTRRSSPAFLSSPATPAWRCWSSPSPPATWTHAWASWSPSSSASPRCRLGVVVLPASPVHLLSCSLPPPPPPSPHAPHTHSSSWPPRCRRRPPWCQRSSSSWRLIVCWASSPLSASAYIASPRIIASAIAIAASSAQGY